MIHWNRSMRRTLPSLAVLIAASFASPARADTCQDGSPAAYFDIQVSGQPVWCQLPFNPGLVTLNVVANAIPFQKVRFTLADAPMGIMAVEAWNGATSGDRVNGLEIDMGGCVGPGPVALGTLYIVVNTEDTAPCTAWNLENCEVQDCTGDWRPAIPVDHAVSSGYCDQCCFQCCYYALAPYDLYPANGATAVPLNVVLSWKGTPEEAIEVPPYGGCSVRISTEPDCSTGTVYPVSCVDDEFAPSFLQPNTTYYWRVSWGTVPGGCTDLNSGDSPLYSFTTEGPLATDVKTWGAVKSMYR